MKPRTSINDSLVIEQTYVLSCNELKGILKLWQRPHLYRLKGATLVLTLQSSGSPPSEGRALQGVSVFVTWESKWKTPLFWKVDAQGRMLSSWRVNMKLLWGPAGVLGVTAYENLKMQTSPHLITLGRILTFY